MAKPSDNLYTADLARVVWATRCGSETPGDSNPDQDSCVEFADIPGHPGALAIRDSKLGPDSPVLRFTADELTAFTATRTQ